MSYSSRHQSSRRAYPHTSDSGHATYEDYEDYSHPLPQHALSSHQSYRSHVLHEGLRSHHSYVSSDYHDPRNISMASRKVTVTEYRIHTSSGESATSHHRRRESTAYDSHRSTSGYRQRRHAPSCSSSDPDDKDERYSSDEGHRDPTWQPSAEERRRHPSNAHAKHSQPKEPKPRYTDGRPSRSKSHSNRKYATNDDRSQGNPESGSSRREESPHSSRSESRRGQSFRTKRNEASHGDHEERYHQEVPRVKAKEDLPDHYATLKIGPHATDKEIKSAAKRRRVEVHPDKLKKEGMSDSERVKIDAAAAMVGHAADVLQNPEQKLRYDVKLYAAKGWKWHGKQSTAVYIYG
ncbi:hypothetical protein HO133_003667 [Letharia lupina]|uniref:J domain-containing protein n=1 Tax=Letharia lupina TaxID=560253 RepID=A0A8H6CAB1_9LECA|nr:uncharacterized protein HO133_003667 [Letharia lupina]KAF6219842.1 hypothetical protein HO133_003667 [Letharia lupina]